MLLSAVAFRFGMEGIVAGRLTPQEVDDVVGTYGSIYVASPLLIWLSRPAKDPAHAAEPVPAPTGGPPAGVGPRIAHGPPRRKGGERRTKRAA